MEEKNLVKDSRPVVVGEVLYDCFPDGVAILGGAPFNVAWHLQGFGLNPLFISRVGNDRHGEDIIAAMRAWGMSAEGIQLDPQHPSGRVQVGFIGGEPHYEIVTDQAYDYIEAAPARALLDNEPAGLLYHGSLIARSERSRHSLDALTAGGLPVFLDINLRDPWWQRDWLAVAMSRARWVKLNEVELAVMTQSDLRDEATLLAQGEALRTRYGIEALVLTRGARGAIVFSAAGTQAARPAEITDFVDTVGAGDAFSAVTIMGLLQAWPTDRLAERAVEFAAAICGQRGATRADPDLYSGFQRKWGV